jgi:hypothetical protein
MSRYSEAWIELDEDAADYADPYPSIREVLSGDYADSAPETIERLVESAYPGLSAEDLEGFFSSLRRAGQAVGQVAQRALPGVIQGATTGSALGPWGALAGGLAGGALSAATSGGAGGARGGGQRGARVRLPARGTPPSTAGSPAVAQLLRTLARPEVGQALRSLAMGRAGQRHVRVGGLSVPTGAITNLLGRLLERAEAEMHAFAVGEASGTPAYLLDDSGEYLVDPTDPDQRADLVLELFARADSFEDEPERSVEVVYVATDALWDEDDEADDEGISLYEGVDYEALSDEDAY